MPLDLPQLNDWMVFVSGLVALLVALGTFVYKLGTLRQSMDDRFMTQGTRIGEVEASCQRSSATIEELKRIDQQHEFQLMGLIRDSGEIRASLDRIAAGIEKNSERLFSEEKESATRLARIEERLDIYIGLHRGGHHG